MNLSLTKRDNGDVVLYATDDYGQGWHMIFHPYTKGETPQTILIHMLSHIELLLAEKNQTLTWHIERR